MPEHDERDYLTSRAKHWQEWSEHSFKGIELEREAGDPDNYLTGYMEEQRSCSKFAREYLFKLIDMGRA